MKITESSAGGCPDTLFCRQCTQKSESLFYFKFKKELLPIFYNITLFTFCMVVTEEYPKAGQIPCLSRCQIEFSKWGGTASRFNVSQKFGKINIQPQMSQNVSNLSSLLQDITKIIQQNLLKLAFYAPKMLLSVLRDH